MANHRSIWKKHYGPIPKDENGFSYEIHHIDGNHKNNDINNLKCVTREEHYEIHLQQEDWGAVAAIVKRNKIKLPPEKLSDILSKQALERIEKGTHHFLSEEFIEKQKVRMKNLYLNGKCVIRDPEVVERAQKTRKEGYLKTNNPLSSKNRKEGTCPHCGKTMDIGNLTQHHGDKCKFKNLPR